MRSNSGSADELRRAQPILRRGKRSEGGRLKLCPVACRELRVASRQLCQLGVLRPAQRVVRQNTELIGIMAVMRRPFGARSRIGATLRLGAPLRCSYPRHDVVSASTVVATNAS